jgi:PAS domain S-box-containing protein
MTTDTRVEDRAAMTGEVAMFALDPVGTILVASQHAPRLLGYSMDELVGRNVATLLSDEARIAGVFDRETVSATMNGTSEFETTMVGKDGTAFLASVTVTVMRGTLHEVGGFAAAVTDISRRRSDTDALRQARSRFESIMDNSLLIAIQGFDESGVIRYWNKASETLFGYVSEEAVGRGVGDVMMEAEEAAHFSEELSAVWKTGDARQPHEWKARSRSGAQVTAFSTMFPILQDGRVVEVFCMDIDVSERARAEESFARTNRLYSVLRKAGEATIRNRDVNKMYEQVCRIAVEEDLFKMAWVGLVDEETQTINPVAHWGAFEGYLDDVRISILEVPDGMGPGGTAVREAHYSVCNDIRSDPLMANWRDKAVAKGFRSNAAFPLSVGSKVVGVIVFYSEEPGFFDDEQVRLLESLAGDISFAIESLDREERRMQAEQRLRESERYYRSLIDNALDVITVLDSEGKIMYTSPSTTRVLGYKRSDVRGLNVIELVHPDDRESAISRLAELMANPGATLDSEYQVRHKDGTYRTIEVFGRSYVDESGTGGAILNARDVTQRRAMEESLQHGEETQRAMLDALSDWAALVDTRGKILALNEAGAARLGKTVDELIGQSMFDTMTNGGAMPRWELAAEVIRTGRPMKFETESDGKFFEISIQPVADEDGKVKTLAVISHDMTSYKQAEMAQRQDQEFVSTVINTTGALVLVLDSDGRTILFNSTCEHVTGFSFDEIRGKYVWDVLIPEDEREDDRAQFEMLLEGKLLPNYENHMLTRHGGRKLISWSNATMFEEDGSVGYVIKTGIDITERRKAEEALKQSEEQYRTMFESTGTAMCIIDDSAKVTFLNQEFERMTGCVAEEVEGVMLLTDFLLPEDAPGFEAYYRESRAVRRNIPLHFECRIMDKLGNKLNVLANMGVIPGRNASVVSLIDISREKSYEHDLQETAERLRHFLTVASHELRHPITIVKGYANTLTAYMEKMPRELIIEILADIDSSTDRLTRYVEELMDVSRVEEGRFPIERRAIDPMELMRTAEEDMQVLGTSNEFNFHVADGTGSVEVDPEKFVQLLVILLENAVKFSDPGTPIDVEVSREDGQVLVSVMDRGIGIREEDRERVFDRFYQVEDALHHSKQGIGLGLYIAKEIVNGHSGKIWCEARPGGGSIFRFTLPQ